MKDQATDALLSGAGESATDAAPAATAGRLLRNALPSRWKLYGLSILFMAGAAAATGALAWSTKLIVNDVFVAEDTSAAVQVAGLVVFVSLMKSVFQYGNSVIQAMFIRSIGADYQKTIFRNLMAKDVWHFDRKHASSQMMQVKILGQACGKTVVNLASKLPADLLTVIALFGVMLFQDPLMTLASCILLPLIFLLVSRLSRKVRAIANAETELTGAYVAIGSEAISGIKTVKSYGLEEKSISRFEAAIASLEDRLLKIAKITSSTVPIMEFLGGLVIGLFVIYAAWQTITFGKTPGEFTAFITAFLLAYQPAERVSHIWVDTQKSLIQVGSMYQMLDEQPRRPSVGTQTLAEVPPSISFDQVSFRYGRKAIALKDVSFEIAAGERVAIVGKSGAGKSTLIDLVLRFYDPQEGTVSIGGVPLPEVTEESLLEPTGRTGIVSLTSLTNQFTDATIAGVEYDVELRSAEAPASNWEVEVTDVDRGSYESRFKMVGGLELPGGLYEVEVAQPGTLVDEVRHPDDVYQTVEYAHDQPELPVLDDVEDISWTDATTVLEGGDMEAEVTLSETVSAGDTIGLHYIITESEELVSSMVGSTGGGGGPALSSGDGGIMSNLWAWVAALGTGAIGAFALVRRRAANAVPGGN